MLRVLDEWLLTPWRVAMHEPTATAVIADVHLGYREARQQSGEAVPLLSADLQLEPLRTAHREVGFRRLLVAGDLFEREARVELLQPFVALLTSLGVEFLGLVPGNHDRGWQKLAGVIPLFPDGIALGPWKALHAVDPFSAPANKLAQPGCFKSPSPPSTAERGVVKQSLNGSTVPSRRVVGHEHPAVRHRGRRLPCYVVAPRLLILPAFSADASGHIVQRLSGCSGARLFATDGRQLLDAGRIEPGPRPRLSAKS